MCVGVGVCVTSRAFVGMSPAEARWQACWMGLDTLDLKLALLSSTCTLQIYPPTARVVPTPHWHQPLVECVHACRCWSTSCVRWTLSCWTQQTAAAPEASRQMGQHWCLQHPQLLGLVVVAAACSVTATTG